MPASAKGPKIKSYWTVFSLALVGFILTNVALVASWVTASITELGVTATFNYYVTGSACVSSAAVSGCSTASNIPAGYLAAEALIIVALILAVLGVVFSLLGALGLTMKGTQAKLSSLFTGLGIPMAFAAPFVFLGTSYDSSVSSSGMFASPYTAGAGWYCAIVAGVILVVAYSMSRTASKEQQAAAADTAGAGVSPEYSGGTMSSGYPGTTSPGYAPQNAAAPSPWSPGSTYPMAGAPVASPPAPAQVACKGCGRVYLVGQFPFCPNCGQKLGS